jgi:hypothetical protein
LKWRAAEMPRRYEVLKKRIDREKKAKGEGSS